MPLTQKHAETFTLEKRAAVQERIKTLTFTQIMDLPALERAEILAALEDRDVRVRMKANTKDPIRFRLHSTEFGVPPQDFEIPGGDQKPRSYPLRAAVYVASNRSYRKFGGRSLEMGKRDPDGVLPVVPVEGDPNRITFELVLNPE